MLEYWKVFKIVVQQGRRRVATGGVDLFTHPPQARLDALLSGGYVKDCDELRTKLAAIFNTGVINIGGCQNGSNKAAAEREPEA